MTVRDSKAPAIARAAAVLRLLGRSDAALPLQAIARELAIAPSTCLYVLRALVAEELVSFDPEVKRYGLEAGVLTLARQWLRRNRFPDLAQPVLDDLAGRFGVTMLGVQIVGLDHIVVVAVSRTGASLQFSASVGSRFPALISATGRCIAAFGDHPADEVERRFHLLRWDDPPAYADWQRQVAETRARGFGIDDGDYLAGVTVAAAPVWKAAGDPSHALVAIGIGRAVRRTGLDALTAALLAGARALSAQMGGGEVGGEGRGGGGERAGAPPRAG